MASAAKQPREAELSSLGILHEIAASLPLLAMTGEYKAGRHCERSEAISINKALWSGGG